jgi:WD40 repeat protein
MLRLPGIFVLALIMLFLPCHAADETFRSLEYGFSIDYPKEAKASAYDIGSIAGMDNPVLNIYVNNLMATIVGVLERNQRPLEDFPLMTQSRYEEDYNITLLGISDIEINGYRAISMDSLIDIDEGMRIKDLFIESDDKVYILSCRSMDNKFKRSNQTYFQKMIASFRTFPIDESIEANLPGFPVIAGDVIWSSPALADINGDGKKEAIFGTNKGKLHAIATSGEDLAGFPVELNDFIRSSPAVSDLDGDQKPEIIVGCDDSMLYVFKEDGTMLSGFPRKASGPISSSPTIGDIDGDNKPEIVVGSRDGGIYAWKHDGSNVCGFPLITEGEIWSSPALGDMNHDGKLEITVGALSICKGLVECLVQYKLGSSGGKIYSLRHNGSILAGFPKSLSETDNIGYSSPILCDMDLDGNMEIVIAGTHDVYVKSSNENQEDIRGFPRKVEGSLQDSFIAVADLDNDQRPEIVAGSTDGKLYVWRADGTTMAGFPVQTGGYVRYITIGDIDADGIQEIIGGSSDNRVHAWKLDGTEVKGFPKATLDDIGTVPALGDIENDGSLEMVVGSNDGQLYVWRISDNYGELAWPTLGQNQQHTGIAKV